MADFYYASSISIHPQKIFQIYAKKDLLDKNVLIFRNYESEHYEYYGNSAYIVGTAQVIDKDKASFIKEVLDDFDEGKLPMIQKKLIGQYILLIYANEKWYILSGLYWPVMARSQSVLPMTWVASSRVWRSIRPRR